MFIFNKLINIGYMLETFSAIEQRKWHNILPNVPVKVYNKIHN